MFRVISLLIILILTHWSSRPARAQAAFCAPEFDWLFQSARGSFQHARGLARDAEGNTILCGSFRGSIQLGSISMRAAGASDGLILKLSPAGALLWAHQLNASEFGELIDAAVDAQGNIVACGYYGASAFPGPNNTLRADFLGNAQIALVKYDASGTLLWGRYYGAESVEHGRTVAIDPAGDIYFGGDFLQFTQIGGLGLNASTAGTFTAKVSRDGTFAWAVGSGQSQFQYALASALGGQIYGLEFAYAPLPAPPRSFQALLRRLDAATGETVWERQSQVGDLALQYLATDPDDNVLVAGYISDRLEFAGAQLDTATNGVQMALLKLDPEGTVTHSTTVGGPALDFPLGLSVQDGVIVLAGTVTGVTNLVLGQVSVAFPSTGAEGVALAFSSDLQAQWAVPLGDHGAEEFACLSPHKLSIAGVALPGGQARLGSCLFPPEPSETSGLLFATVLSIPEPRLRLAPNGAGGQKLIWPKIYGDHILERLDSIPNTPTPAWVAVQGAVTNVFGFLEIDLSPLGPSAFYRLRKDAGN